EETCSQGAQGDAVPNPADRAFRQQQVSSQGQGLYGVGAVPLHGGRLGAVPYAPPARQEDLLLAPPAGGFRGTGAVQGDKPERADRNVEPGTREALEARRGRVVQWQGTLR